MDTTVLIDYLNGREHVVLLVQNLAREGHSLGCCCINVAEVYAGLKEHERELAKELIESLEYFEVTRDIAISAGKYRYEHARQGRTLAITDAIIGACALAYEATLLTANVNHYPMEKLKIKKIPTQI